MSIPPVESDPHAANRVVHPHFEWVDDGLFEHDLRRFDPTPEPQRQGRRLVALLTDPALGLNAIAGARRGVRLVARRRAHVDLAFQQEIALPRVELGLHPPRHHLADRNFEARRVHGFELPLAARRDVVGQEEGLRREFVFARFGEAILRSESFAVPALGEAPTHRREALAVHEPLDAVDAQAELLVLLLGRVVKAEHPHRELRVPLRANP